MKLRHSLNSQILKEQFPKVYRDFFSKCQIVVSAPHFFTWAGEYVGYWGGIMTLQKIPFRIYVGIEQITDFHNQQPISFSNNCQSYSLSKNKFQKDQYDPSNSQRVIDFLQQNEFFENKKFAPFRIHLLCEIPFGGSGSESAFCAALSCCLLLQEGMITPNDIKNWTEPTVQELKENKNLKFDKVFRLAWKILSAFRNKETSGATVLAPLISSANPIFYYLKTSSEYSLPLEINRNYGLLDRVDFQAGKMEEIFNISSSQSLPFDFGLIYLGEPKGTTPYSTNQSQEIMKATSQFANKNFPGLAFSRKNNLWQANLQVMNFLSCEVFKKMGEALEAGNQEDTIKNFLQTIDKHQALFLILNALSDNIGTMASIIKSIAKKIDEIGAGLKSVSTTKKDIALLVAPHGKAQHILEKSIPQLKKSLETNAYLGYASWIDGIEEKALMIEQFLTQKIYSPFISQDSIFLTQYAKNQQPATLVLTEEKFQSQKNGIDILLESQNNRIFINGKRLTSKELHSSRIASQILKIMLENQEKIISNKDLPQSAYTQDRYEFQGKIASPLIKAVKIRTQKSLGLKVSGGITDFKVQLNLNNLIAWLKR